VGATIVVWLVNWFLHGAFGLREASKSARRHARHAVIG
jgi:hypothetical protein